MYAGGLESLARVAREKGARVEATGAGGDDSSVKSLGGQRDPKENKEAKKDVGVVHFLKNQPPLDKKTVEKIREGAFVEFAMFPVFDDGPSVTGGLRLDGGDPDDGGSIGATSKRKSTMKEIPDLATWSTCFTLFNLAWATGNADMWIPLAAYREVIFRLAKRHPWAQVVRYDRRFRREAAGRNDVVWGEENFPLMLDVTHSSQPTSSETKPGGGFASRRADSKKRGTCFRFNKGEGRCNFGQQCRFNHVCATCGGEHPAAVCKTTDKSS